MASNFIIGDFISRLRIASSKRLKSIKIDQSVFCLEILKVLWLNGVINGFSISCDGRILVFLKYYDMRPAFRDLKIISRPGKRVFWTLNSMNLKYSRRNFSGFFVVATPCGVITSNECIMSSHSSGEIILQVLV